ncbi:MAG: hypothetical protein AAFX56_18270 [Pseudomonadota bacterium]
MVESKPMLMDGGVGTAVYCFKDACCAGPETPAAMQLREEHEFYVPDLLADADYHPRPALFSAAEAYGRRLQKADRHVDEALLLSQVLRGSMCDDSDGRAMQVDTVLKIVEKKLRKAHLQIDRYETSHLNLFMAYMELRESG